MHVFLTYNPALPNRAVTMRTVLLNKEPVELFKLLKFEGLAESGGAAKQLIEQELVYVNGAVETRKRKKIIAGDVIKIGDEEFTTALDKRD